LFRSQALNYTQNTIPFHFHHVSLFRHVSLSLPILSSIFSFKRSNNPQVSFLKLQMPSEAFIQQNESQLPTKFNVNTTIVRYKMDRKAKTTSPVFSIWDICFMPTAVENNKLIEGNAKCRHLKKLACKGTLRQVFICLKLRSLSPPPLLTHCTVCKRVCSILIHTGKGGGGGGN
jgi:hypothetical protein